MIYRAVFLPIYFITKYRSCFTALSLSAWQGGRRSASLFEQCSEYIAAKHGTEVPSDFLAVLAKT